jgi:hypothetical protein
MTQARAGRTARPGAVLDRHRIGVECAARATALKSPTVVPAETTMAPSRRWEEDTQR